MSVYVSVSEIYKLILSVCTYLQCSYSIVRLSQAIVHFNRLVVCVCVCVCPCIYTGMCVSVSVCVVMPLHEWATGSLPPAGSPPTRQVGPSEVHVSV